MSEADVPLTEPDHDSYQKMWEQFSSEASNEFRPSAYPSIPSLTDLPDELVVHILSFLALPVRKRVRMVSRWMRELSFTPCLVKNDVFVVDVYKDLDQLDFRRRYYNIKIMKAASTKPCFCFWKNCGQYVKSIEMFLYSERNPGLEKIIPFVPNLEHFGVSSMDEFQTEKLPFENRVCLCGKSFKSQLQFTLPKLQSLSMIRLGKLMGNDANQILKETPALTRLYFDLTPSKDRRSLVNFIKRRKNHLVDVSLNRCPLTDAETHQVLNKLTQKLTSLQLRRCKSQLIYFDCFLRFPDLKELDLSESKTPDSVLYETICKLENLTHISFNRTQVSNATLSLLALRSELCAIDLSDCKLVNTEGLRLALCQLELPNLVDLRLSKLKMKNPLILDILNHVPNLQHLYLNGCLTLTNRLLDHIGSKCKHLRTLSLQYCQKLTKTVALNQVKTLQHLDLFGCLNVPDNLLSKIALPELQTIHLGTTSVTERGVQAIIANCPALQDMYLDKELEEEYNSLEYSLTYSIKLHFGFRRSSEESIFDRTRFVPGRFRAISWNVECSY